MNQADVLIDQMAFSLAGVKDDDASGIVQLVIQKLKAKCPEITQQGFVQNLDIAVDIPSGTPDYMYAEIIAQQIMNKLR